ncbi:tRNA U34 2-thiouridine synthase MnmA/TrmU [Sinorhizobium fredii]
MRRDTDGIYVELLDGEAGVAPGQACALYSGTGENARVYGGGFIRKSEREPAAEAALQALLQAPAAA